MENVLKPSHTEKKEKIQQRLRDFKNLDEEEYIKEFIFCLLTPQSNAQKCWEAVKKIFELKEINESNVKKILRSRTRFHNTKAKRVVLGFSGWEKVKEKILSEKNVIKLRNWLAENVNGYGLKEAGHFLRNIGKSESRFAILDRHILKNLKAEGIISNEKIKSKCSYFEIEKRFLEYSAQIEIPADELDLLFWSKENGEIFK